MAALDRSRASSSSAAKPAPRRRSTESQLGSGASSKPGPTLRGGTLVKLKGLERRYNGKLGRVVEMKGPLRDNADGSAKDGLVAVLLDKGVWVAVPPERLEVQ